MSRAGSILATLALASAASAQDAPRLLEGPFAPGGGHAWHADAPDDWPSDAPGDESTSTLVLLEDGAPLGPAHALHADIRAHGAGRYSHWRGALIFSASDNSDPNVNGRRYVIAPASAAREDAGGGAGHPRPPALRRVALEPPFARRAGQAWLASVPDDWPADGPGAPRRSALVLGEDGVRLGPAHATHDAIAADGGGRYSHWESQLVFSTSDGSDPNENGRAYVAELVLPSGLGEYGYEAFPLTAPFVELEAAERQAARARRRQAPLLPGAPPTIWWYTIDALRHDVPFSTRGGEPVMPHLAAFAGEAVVFENAYVSAPNTKLSTASMFTGLWPTRHGVSATTTSVWPTGTRLADPLDARFDTLPELLLEHGYDTWTHPYTVFVHRGSGLLQGFAHVDLDAGADVPLHTDAERLFAYEHVLGLHAPYAPSGSARAALAIPGSETVDPASTDWYRATLDARQRDALWDAYLAEGRDADALLGRRLAWLRETGRYDDALVIVTSDHGEEFLEHGGTAHSTQLYEEVVRVPLFVKFPKDSAWAAHHGERVSHRVRLVDLYPTILELVTHARPRHQIDGRSLLPILAGVETDATARDVVLRMALSVPLDSTPGALPIMTVDGIVRGRLKAIFGYRMYGSQDAARRFAQGDWFAEVYDLADDPHERVDLLPGRLEDFYRLADAQRASARPLQPWRDDAPAAASPPDEPTLPAELEARLRELGYLR